MKKGTIIISLLMIILCICLFRMTLNFPPAFDPNTLGPAGLPQILLIIWAGLSLLLLVTAWRSRKETPLFRGRVGVVIIAAIGSFAYLALIPLLGYFLATLLFAVGLMTALDSKRWISILLVSSGWIIFAYFTFYKLLGVPLPLGILSPR
jgi:putative tricarboxylic transport membrane protein